MGKKNFCHIYPATRTFNPCIHYKNVTLGEPEYNPNRVEPRRNFVAKDIDLPGMNPGKLNPLLEVV